MQNHFSFEEVVEEKDGLLCELTDTIYVFLSTYNRRRRKKEGKKDKMDDCFKNPGLTKNEPT
jgi:hypothetical protein